MIKQTLASLVLAGLIGVPVLSVADSAAELDDREIAHVAYTADNVDIRYAHLALAISKSPKVRSFAETMIRDHTIVNERALALLERLGVTPKDNFLSRQMLARSDELVAKMSQLSGAEFDRFYMANELAYHKAVNDLVEGTFIPNVETPELAALLAEALAIFKGHQHSAHDTVAVLTD